MSDLFEQLANITRPINTKEFIPIAYIHLDKSINTASGRTMFLEEGLEVTVKDGKLVDTKEKPTHVITGLFGNGLGGNSSIHLSEIGTLELSIIKL